MQKTNVFDTNIKQDGFNVPIEYDLNWKKSNYKNKIHEYNLETFHRSNQDTCILNRPSVREGDWVQSGDLLADGSASVGGELALGQNILIAYLPWEGYNFEDAILINERLVFDETYTSIHIERYETEIRDTKTGKESISPNLSKLTQESLHHLDESGVVKVGTWVKEGDILVGKLAPLEKKTVTGYERLMQAIIGQENFPFKDSSLRVPKGMKAKVIEVLKIGDYSRSKRRLNQKRGWRRIRFKTRRLRSFVYFQSSKFGGFQISQINKVYLYLAEKRKIQVGDKVSGRHGNKGIISQILNRQDMPYMPDGTPIDMVLNPLGVPSRMNVGQIYECLLGLAGKILGEHYKIIPFDESYGAEASRSFVFSKLYEARQKTGCTWLFNPKSPGKMRLFDGRTGEVFHQNVTVGRAYMLKLVHMVDDKIHSRSTGPYSLVTQQPLRGRSKQGGQRVGEMEVWAFEAYGAAFILLELLTLKSDDREGREALWQNLVYEKPYTTGIPDSFQLLICELQALCIDIGIYKIDNTFSETISDLQLSPPFKTITSEE